MKSRIRSKIKRIDLVWDEGDSQLLVDHEGEDSHHGGTALVELDGALLELGLLVEGVPAEVEGVVAEVTDEFSSGDVLHDGELEEANEGDQLSDSGTLDGVEGGEAVWHIGEGEAGVVDVSWEADSGLLDQVSDDGEHGDASVLDLDVTEAVELLLVSVSDEAERIEESERGLGAELVLEGLDGGGAGGLLGRGEGGGGGDEGGDDDGLHFGCYCLRY
mmetsp:Transcript_3045/g.8595  ORF Transcript_3045/g.8595 Transcript_3045/m.8595 type:complete len:218 (-) Transcript_3045:42-695(-)